MSEMRDAVLDSGSDLEQTYREMLLIALAKLQAAHAEQARLQARYEALRDELRRYVETRMTE